MNSYSIQLSSNSTEYFKKYDTLFFEDYSNLIVTLEDLSESYIPIYLKIDWGDGNNEIFENDLFTTDDDVSKKSSILNNTYTHEYKPSETSLYKNLSAQFLINYSNGDNTWFVIPIQIRTYDYFESLEDVEILNHSVMYSKTDFKKRITLRSLKDSYILNMESSG